MEPLLFFSLINIQAVKTAVMFMKGEIDPVQCPGSQRVKKTTEW